jgi:hypothetical protein
MHMSLKRRGLPVNLSCSRPWPLFWPEVGNDTHFWPVFWVKVGSASGLLVDVVVDNDLGLLVDVGNGTQNWPVFWGQSGRRFAKSLILLRKLLKLKNQNFRPNF